MLLPQRWGELGDATGRVIADTLEHIDQGSVRVDVMQAQVTIQL